MTKQELEAVKERVLNILAGDGDIGMKMNSQVGTVKSESDILVEAWSKELQGQDLTKADKNLDQKIKAQRD